MRGYTSRVTVGWCGKELGLSRRNKYLRYFRKIQRIKGSLETLQSGDGTKIGRGERWGSFWTSGTMVHRLEGSERIRHKSEGDDDFILLKYNKGNSYSLRKD